MNNGNEVRTTNYKAVVVDNSVEELQETVEFLTDSGEFDRIISFHDAQEAALYIDEHGCDIFFTEIEMPKLTGLDLARKYGKNNLSMCFVMLTHKKHYALDAFSLGVTDFVVKPLHTKALIRVIRKYEAWECFKKSE